MRHDEIEEMRTLPLFVGVASTHVESMLRASFLQRFPAHVELAARKAIQPIPARHHRWPNRDVLGLSRSRDDDLGDRTRPQLHRGRRHTRSRLSEIGRALLPSRVLLIPAEAVRRSFGEDAAFSARARARTGWCLSRRRQELKNQKLRSSLERLANWVLTHDGESGGTGRFELPFDKKVLASRLGMAPEVLSRSIAALVPYGVKVSGRAVEIGDMGALTGLAHPSPTIDGTVS